MADQWREHAIVNSGDKWLYTDTKTPVEDNERVCGHCDKANTTEGHDACLGALKGVMNACCGHGVSASAYVQFLDGSVISGEDASLILEDLKDNKMVFSKKEFMALATFAMCNDSPEDAKDIDIKLIHSILNRIAIECLGFSSWIQAYHRIV